MNPFLMQIGLGGFSSLKIKIYLGDNMLLDEEGEVLKDTDNISM